MVDCWCNDGVPFEKCSYGRAAKVIAIYLKTVKGMAGESAKLGWLYLPIDRQLLLAIRREAKGGKSNTLLNWTSVAWDEHVRLMGKITGLQEMEG